MNSPLTRPVSGQIDDGIQAWDAYQRTGLHATAEEVDAWLAQLEQGQDAEPPECRV